MSYDGGSPVLYRAGVVTQFYNCRSRLGVARWSFIRAESFSVRRNVTCTKASMISVPTRKRFVKKKKTSIMQLIGIAGIAINSKNRGFWYDRVLFSAMDVKG